jgi:hypothetical protein
LRPHVRHRHRGHRRLWLNLCVPSLERRSDHRGVAGSE